MECSAFHWIGQRLDRCHNCGRHITEHSGMDWMPVGAGPFGVESEQFSFAETARRSPMFAAHLASYPFGADLLARGKVE